MQKTILDGIRVLELTQLAAGPLAGRMLASHGAECIQVESTKWFPFMRLYGVRDLEGRIYSGTQFHVFSGMKRSITLDFHHPEGMKALRELIKKSDVLLENYSVEAIARFGLEYPAVRELNPRIIHIRMPAVGLEGPYKDALSYGIVLQAFGGLSQITGYPDGPPAMPGHSTPDYIAALHATLAIVAALDYRRRTGEGQFIEVSQLESMMCLLETAFLDYTANGRIRGRLGNRHPYAAPHGAYPCLGEDRWCVIAVFSDEEWKGFCDAMGNPAWTKEPRFATLLGRLDNAAELDELISAWTKDLAAEEVMQRMQQRGVAAGVVFRGQELIEDAHLKERGYFRDVTVPGVGLVPCHREPLLYSDASTVFRDFPGVGEDNDYVYGELLGMSKEEIKRLAEEGAFA